VLPSLIIFIPVAAIFAWNLVLGRHQSKQPTEHMLAIGAFCGVVLSHGANRLMQDMLGLEGYIEYFRANERDLSPVWGGLIMAVVIPYLLICRRKAQLLDAGGSKGGDGR